MVQSLSPDAGRSRSGLFHSVIAASGVAAMGLAWNFPGGIEAAVLAWISSIAMIIYARSLARPYRAFFAGSLLAHLLGFYWLFYTIRDFGGFGSIPAGIVFFIFLAGSSVQFLIFAFISRNLPRIFERLAVSCACAWAVSEYISIRIFPWSIGHTQAALKYLPQIADIGGVTLVSFLVMWLAEAFVKTVREKKLSAAAAAAVVVFAAANLYGYFKYREFSRPFADSQEVALIQANISIEEKHNVKMFKENSARYFELSRQAASDNLLIIWPETVITDWIYAKLPSVYADQKGILPVIENNSFLIGALSFTSPKELHNSAIAILPDGSMPPPYHKQILMPFGEYTPFGDLLPWLRELNATSGDFTAGKGVSIFEYPPVRAELPPVRVSPLICYEDLVPSLSREAVRRGADLLVNITNDAWFGDTAAPFQHHLIASFRAIENRRFLLRSTNSGYTAIVDAAGDTIGSIPVYSEGVLRAQAGLVTAETVYTRFIGEYPWPILTCIVLIGILMGRRGRRVPAI